MVEVSRELDSVVQKIIDNHNKDRTSKRVLENRIKLAEKIEKFHKDADTLTDSVKKKIELIKSSEDNFILWSGHQPNLFPY
ncbi:MAG: hypothetical protein KAS32_25725, partial [Candidatus Peribacteraceae bacterium]|nr:hypothetical protein [Candidatus Peribacteraceae bacterium]